MTERPPKSGVALPFAKRYARTPLFRRSRSMFSGHVPASRLLRSFCDERPPSSTNPRPGTCSAATLCAASPHRSTSGARLPSPEDRALRAPAPGHKTPAGERREVAVADIRAARVVKGPLYISLGGARAIERRVPALCAGRAVGGHGRGEEDRGGAAHPARSASASDKMRREMPEVLAPRVFAAQWLVVQRKVEAVHLLGCRQR